MKGFNTKLPILFAIIILLLLYGKIPAQASTSFEKLGVLDKPAHNSTLFGQSLIKGWYLDANGVSKIEILVDGKIVGRASYGDQRLDVLKAYPQFKNGNAGFHYTLDTTQLSNGLHTISIKETARNGSTSILPSKTVTISNFKGYLDSPGTGANLNGNESISGWMLDSNGVEKIEVLVDKTVVGEAVYGDTREDVYYAYPQFNNENAGFHFTFDTTKFSDGQHTVTIKGTGLNGTVNTLPVKTVKIANFKGYLDNPRTASTLTGTYNLSGWILDSSGVEKIEVLVDNTVVDNAIYGDARDDVFKAYSQFNNENAGYHLTLDTTKFSDGQHTITIKETGVNGNVNILPVRTVTFANMKGYLDNPHFGEKLIGTTNISGWMLDSIGVEKIEILLDDSVVGQAVYGDEREDVLEAYPKFNNGNAGFHYSLDTTKYSDGNHTLKVKKTAFGGQVTELLERTVTIANVKGYVDTPAPGSTVVGKKDISGWFLDASGVSTIEVLVDGVSVGQAFYGDQREDVQKAYPQFNNANSGFHFMLDTAEYGDGKHILTIKETGMNGNVKTLPEIPLTFKQSITVFLDPGHGGADSGAISGVYREKDLNLAVAKKVQSILLSRGYKVFMSRETDTYVSLLDRSIMANDLHPDIFVSIHHNSTSDSSTTINGIESYYYEYDPDYPTKINADMHNNPDRIAKSKTLTTLIQSRLINYTGATNRGVLRDTFSVLRESAMPATLIECGYMNNATELKKLVTTSYQNSVAKAIADGIEEYFKLY